MVVSARQLHCHSFVKTTKADLEAALRAIATLRTRQPEVDDTRHASKMEEIAKRALAGELGGAATELNREVIAGMHAVGEAPKL